MTKLSRISYREALWGALSVACVLATLGITRWQLRRESPVSAKPRTVENPARFTEAGIVIGDTAAPVRIVAFSDFECRYCRQLRPTLALLLLRYPGEVAIVYRHFPLSSLGFAIPAAIAAECAAAQHGFEPFADLLFASQDTLTRLALDAVAVRAGVADTAAFRACRSGPQAKARLNEDIEAGKLLGVVATPTLLIGDQLVIGDVPLERLERLLRSVQKQ